MNKTHLKRYMNNKGNIKNELKSNCFRLDNSYIVSDSYSIIKLNDSYGLNIMNDKYNLGDMFKDFENSYNISYTFFTPLEDNEEMYEPIDEHNGINIKLFKRISKVINANEFSVLENANRFANYIIKLENTKTKEVAYMLPMKKY